VLRFGGKTGDHENFMESDSEGEPVDLFTLPAEVRWIFPHLMGVFDMALKIESHISNIGYRRFSVIKSGVLVVRLDGNDRSHLLEIWSKSPASHQNRTRTHTSAILHQTACDFLITQSQSYHFGRTECITSNVTDRTFPAHFVEAELQLLERAF
jgi:hypothetical protein